MNFIYGRFLRISIVAIAIAIITKPAAPNVYISNGGIATGGEAVGVGDATGAALTATAVDAEELP